MLQNPSSLICYLFPQLLSLWHSSSLLFEISKFPQPSTSCSVIYLWTPPGTFTQKNGCCMGHTGYRFVYFNHFIKMEIKCFEKGILFTFMLKGYRSASPSSDKSSTGLGIGWLIGNTEPQECIVQACRREEEWTCWPCVLGALWSLQLCSTLLCVLVPMRILEVGISLSVKRDDSVSKISQTSVILKTKNAPLIVQRNVIIFFPVVFRNLMNSVQRN